MSTTLGRIADIKLPAGSLKSVLALHIVLPLPANAHYRKLNMRHRGDWSLLFRSRALLSDLYVATRGHSVGHPYLMAEIRDVVLDMLLPPATRTATTDFARSLQPYENDIDELSYRLRVMMSHLRSAKAGNWQVPKRFDSLKAVIQLAALEQLEPSHVEEELFVTPTKRKSAHAVSDILPSPPPFGSPAPLGIDDTQKPDLFIVETPSPKVDVVCIDDEESYQHFFLSPRTVDAITHV